jgi:hypothetical protein
VVNSLDLPWQSKMYLANFYCGFHAWDCDLQLLTHRASECMQEAETADSIVFNEFLNYC